MTPLEGQAILDQMFAPWVQALRLRVNACDAASATLVLPFDPSLVRVGGIVCGQALMSAADSAMVIAISSALGGLRPMATASLNTSFMRPVANTDVELVARVLKLGKSLVFGDIEMRAVGDERLVGHATTTYALVPG